MTGDWNKVQSNPGWVGDKWPCALGTERCVQGQVSLPVLGGGKGSNLNSPDFKAIKDTSTTAPPAAPSHCQSSLAYGDGWSRNSGDGCSMPCLQQK